MKLIKVFAYCKAYDPDFDDTVYTEEAFEAFLKDLLEKINDGSVFDDDCSKSDIKVKLAENKILFGDITLSWIELKPIDKHESIEHIAFKSEGYESTYLMIE